MLSHVIGGITGWAADRPFYGAFLAVDLFFVLSGFVLSKLLLAEKYGFRAFFWMRFWRLWPLHVATILLCIVVYELNRSVGHYAPPDVMFSDIPLILENAAFLMTLGIVDVAVINDPSWSIGIEFWLSALLLPLLIRGSLAVLLAIIVAAYLFIAIHAHGLMAIGAVYPFVSLGVLKGIAGMSLGVAICKVEEPLNSKLENMDVQWYAALISVSFAFTAAAIVWQNNSLLNFAVIVAIIPVLAARSFSRLRSINGFLSSKPLVWLGTISFSLYLVHTPVLVLLDVPTVARSLGGVNAAIFLSVACILAGAAVHYFFEKPVARIVKGFGRKATGGDLIGAATRPSPKEGERPLDPTPSNA